MKGTDIYLVQNKMSKNYLNSSVSLRGYRSKSKKNKTGVNQFIILLHWNKGSENYLHHKKIVTFRKLHFRNSPYRQVHQSKIVLNLFNKLQNFPVIV
jgi:hypothetical protein